ncbi:YbgA family protein [Teredinibacter waterburyi]|jgi:Uncharacterized conserved protein|uniref:YbgA family protein n=1 Tax=Teredinibacter waterburyi TaxID=1500538 RepID=UPI00165FFE2C|nr:DUF523 and DUF1722 domain-containing protein [Teredinibacter waterburyi]
MTGSTTHSTNTTAALPIKVGVSSCLMGEAVRFDGGHKRQIFLERVLSQYFEFKTFCPEMSIGLGVPRQTIRIVNAGNNPLDPIQRVVGTRDSTLDVTEKLSDSADQQQEWVADLCGYILKKDSPSCGMERVKVYTNGQPSRTGVGLFAQQLMRNNPNLPVEEEGRLHDRPLRENFIERVYVMHRWKQMLADGLTPKALVDFHRRHKFNLMSRHQDYYRKLGQMIANIPRNDLDNFAAEYLAALMQCLRKQATRRNHINVLQHIQGYLKRDIDSVDKHEINEALAKCRNEGLPLTVPMTLLRHHFRKNPNDYIGESYYFAPYPDELQYL